jgi:glutaredoxin
MSASLPFPLPSSASFTIYTKSKCPFCTKAKILLKSQNPLIISCDDFLVDPSMKANFLQFIHGLAKREHKSFPIVFDKGVFIGGYFDTQKYLHPSDGDE